MNKIVPMRLCTGCRKMVPKNECIRVVKLPDNLFHIDETGKANGRGAYICKSHECLAKAIKGNGLERSFKMRIPLEIKEALLKEMIDIEEQ